jgi:enterobactin synthetase component D
MPVPTASPPLFPSFVAQHTVLFDVDESTNPSHQFPGVVLPASLANAAPKRQAEFLAGRFCVREALRECAPEHAHSAIAIGPDRAPLWPPGIVGAITHTDGFASVAVARAVHARAIGLDAERIIADDRAECLLESIADRCEVAAIARATGWSIGTALTAVFSAKETVFKCLYAEARRYFDFRDARLDALGPYEGKFHARLLTTIAPSLPAGQVITGRFSVGPRIVYTAMVLPP